MMALDDVVAETARAYAGRKWIVAAGAAAAATGFVQDLQEWDAEDILVLSAAPGAGNLPDAPIHYTGTTGDTMMSGIRAFTESVTHPDAATRAAVERYDPDGSALVLVESFVESGLVVGRRVFGARRPEWVALEDKTVIDDVWDRAGVPRAPSAVVPVAEAAAAAGSLAGAHGTVWTADNREGWHGGAAYTRWVADAADAAEAESWFRDRADSVRVMPFFDGIPCSFHGFVANDGRRCGWPPDGPQNCWPPPSATWVRSRLMACAAAAGSDRPSSIRG